MADAITKTPRKLKGREIIEVDTQILRWRMKMRKEEIALGRHTRKHNEKMKRNKEENAMKREGGITKKKWF